MTLFFQDEQLWAGFIGQVCLLLAFSSILFACISLVQSVRSDTTPTANSWRRLGNIAFILHFIFVFTVIAILFYLFYAHRFEYEYIWRHSSTTMLSKYLLASMWAGQQGSFLLWIFWHGVLGLLIIKLVSARWSAPVLVVIAFLQSILLSMVMGKIGRAHV